jgi:hypothetical protein
MSHQYSSGSLPSISRTCVRAQSGHNQLGPPRPFSMLQANASAGAASARDLPQRLHTGDSVGPAMAHIAASLAPSSKMDSRGTQQENVVTRAGERLVVRIQQTLHRMPIRLRQIVLAHTRHPRQPVHNGLPNRLRSRRRMIDHITERRGLDEPGNPQRLGPPDGQSHGPRHLGPHPLEPDVPGSGQPAPETRLTDPEIPGQAPRRKPTLGEREPPTGSKHPSKPINGLLLIGKVMHHARSPHEIGRRQHPRQAIIGGVHLHPVNPHGVPRNITSDLNGGRQQLTNGIRQDDPPAAAGRERQSQLHTHPASPRPDIHNNGRHPTTGRQQPNKPLSNSPIELGINRVSPPHGNEPLSPVDPVMRMRHAQDASRPSQPPKPDHRPPHQPRRAARAIARSLHHPNHRRPTNTHRPNPIRPQEPAHPARQSEPHGPTSTRHRRRGPTTTRRTKPTSAAEPTPSRGRATYAIARS